MNHYDIVIFHQLLYIDTVYLYNYRIAGSADSILNAQGATSALNLWRAARAVCRKAFELSTLCQSANAGGHTSSKVSRMNIELLQLIQRRPLAWNFSRNLVVVDRNMLQSREGSDIGIEGAA